VSDTLGALLTGIFASSAINAAYGNDASGKPIPTGVIDRHWHRLLNQAADAGIAWGLAIARTLVLLFIVDKLV
jgi:ammonia channel protein AmtB